MSYYDEEKNKLAFRDWKVFIDNSSEWFDEINKKLAQCYINTDLIKQVYPQIRTFTSSRSANLENISEINSILNQVRGVLYSEKYNEMKKNNTSGVWDDKILLNLDKCIQLLSKGLSEGELTPKANKKEVLPYEKQGNANDLINKALTKNNNTSLNKDGRITANKN